MTVFATLLKNIPIGFPDSVLSEPLLRHTEVNCLLSNIAETQNQLIRSGKFKIFGKCKYIEINKCINSGHDPKSFLVVTLEDLHVVEESVQ